MSLFITLGFILMGLIILLGEYGIYKDNVYEKQLVDKREKFRDRIKDMNVETLKLEIEKTTDYYELKEINRKIRIRSKL